MSEGWQTTNKNSLRFWRDPYFKRNVIKVRVKTAAQVLSEIASAAALEKSEGESKTRTRQILEELSKFDWKSLQAHSGTAKILVKCVTT